MKLHLVLKSKWYDMIESGEKLEEYRKFNTYWKKRLGTNKQDEAMTNCCKMLDMDFSQV